MSVTYLANLEYRGKSFLGWQIQSTHEETVQGKIKQVLLKLCHDNLQFVVGSSRTDRGVHALHQYCKLIFRTQVDTLKLLKSLNSLLAPEIRFLSIEEVDSNFNFEHEIKWKEYCYYFVANALDLSPFLADFVTPFLWPLDLSLMQKSASMVQGTHDFYNFRVMGTPTKTTIRHVYSSIIEEVPVPFFFQATKNSTGAIFCYKIVGDGFLKQMVRMIVGGIISVGRGKTSLTEFENALKHPLIDRIAPLAPAQGLFLNYTSFKKYPER